MNNTLIIEIPYGGLGDHLFHSHLPRIAKESGKYDKVLISNESLYRHPDYKKLVWEYNPFIDGFVNDHGLTCDLKELVEKVNEDSKFNLLDQIMFAFGLENGKRWNEPEIYYVPKHRKEFEFKIYDPNFLSWVGSITAIDSMNFFKKKRYNFEKIMMIRSDKCLFIPNNSTEFIETPTIEDFCDLIHSSKQLYCLTSGTATIAAALGKKAIVFYGDGQSPGFRHSKQHVYLEIKPPLLKKIYRKIIN